MISAARTCYTCVRDVPILSRSMTSRELSVLLSVLVCYMTTNCCNVFIGRTLGECFLNLTYFSNLEGDHDQYPNILASLMHLCLVLVLYHVQNYYNLC